MMPAVDMSSLNNLEINIIRYIHKEILTRPVDKLYLGNTRLELRKVGIRHILLTSKAGNQFVRTVSHPTCHSTQAKKMCKSKHMGHYCQGTYCHSSTLLESIPYLPIWHFVHC